MSSTDYRRKSTSREDPRLAARRESTSIYDDLDGSKSKQESPRAASRDPRIRDDSATWRGHEQGYNQQMQTAYQHLPTAVYPEVCLLFLF